MSDLPLGPDPHAVGPAIRRALIVYHPKVAAAWDLMGTLEREILARGVDVMTGSVWDADELRRVLPEVDVCITLGGDGSMLRAARMAAPFGVPILGINLGRLGFLAELEPGAVSERLPAILDGRYWIEERMMISAELQRNGETIATSDCLNEVVVARRQLSRVVRVRASIDGYPITTYVADGMMVATPTGSTAYSLAAGGPILHPEVRNMVLTPISAHLSLRSPIVLPEATTVQMALSTDHEAGVSFDGQTDMLMETGDVVVVRAGPHSARFLRAQERTYFYHTLIHKLGLAH